MSVFKFEMNTSNHDRAVRAFSTLHYYADRYDEKYDEGRDRKEWIQQTMVDLVADLYHLCDKEGLAVDEVERIASDHHTAEVEEETL